jgi:hypothetical protein
MSPEVLQQKKEYEYVQFEPRTSYFLLKAAIISKFNSTVNMHAACQIAAAPRLESNSDRWTQLPTPMAWRRVQFA